MFAMLVAVAMLTVGRPASAQEKDGASLGFTYEYLNSHARDRSPGSENVTLCFVGKAVNTDYRQLLCVSSA
jgi:hypothetical protein